MLVPGVNIHKKIYIGICGILGTSFRRFRKQYCASGQTSRGSAGYAPSCRPGRLAGKFHLRNSSGRTAESRRFPEPGSILLVWQGASKAAPLSEGCGTFPWASSARPLGMSRNRPRSSLLRRRDLRLSPEGTGRSASASDISWLCDGSACGNRSGSSRSAFGKDRGKDSGRTRFPKGRNRIQEGGG